MHHNFYGLLRKLEQEEQEHHQLWIKRTSPKSF
jgi:hypothetical protein